MAVQVEGAALVPGVVVVGDELRDLGGMPPPFSHETDRLRVGALTVHTQLRVGEDWGIGVAGSSRHSNVRSSHL
jgi:hypothetical protein